ncbi:MAG: cyanophycinase [Ignavibacteriales bacterium]|nr:MAG: cyanophycinase [Ignavibacteriales bacterium]
MKLKLKTIALFFLVGITFPLLAQNKGKLFIIGGGDRPVYMMEKYIELAGGKDSRFIVIPMASSEPLESADYMVKELKELGCKNVDFIYCNKENADIKENLAKLDKVTGVYFCGGDQALLTAALLGTKVLDKIKDVYRNGGVVGGTSAGAAVMSKIMLTGNEWINKDTINLFTFIKRKNVETIEGFGFIQNAIIDQHFITRKRLNRLISVVLENPALPGIGIDEATAIIFNPDNTFEVFGENTVLIFDATEARDIMTDKNNNLSAADLKMHLLKSGDVFDLKSKKKIN